MTAYTTHISLLTRLSAGRDPSVWDEFLDRYGPLIDGFCRRRGLQDADREDVKQDVLISLSTAMPGFVYDPSKGLFRSYLKTVVVHAIFKKLRQVSAPGSLESVNESTAASSHDPTFEQAWEAEWRQHHLRQAMRTIDAEFNEATRNAFRRYAVEGGDAKETADLLGLTIEQVYQAKSRIMRRIAELIALQVQDEG